MKIHNVTQGTDEWKKLRAEHFTASEAPAMMGVSKHMKRDALLHQHYTGQSKPVNDFTQRLFDRGHEAEEQARLIAEEIIGEELFPATVTDDIDGLPLLASMDGMNMAGDIIWEHKLWNDKLSESMESGNISKHYLWQIGQQLLVSGAGGCLFMTSDGTKDNCTTEWVNLDVLRVALGMDWEKRLVDGWNQFAVDLEAYEPPVVTEADEEMQSLYSNLEALKEQKQCLDDEIKAIESELKGKAESLGAKEVVGQGFKVALVERKGSVDYKKIPELKAVNLDEYRKEPTFYYQVKAVKQDQA